MTVSHSVCFNLKLRTTGEGIRDWVGTTSGFGRYEKKNENGGPYSKKDFVPVFFKLITAGVVTYYVDLLVIYFRSVC